VGRCAKAPNIAVRGLIERMRTYYRLAFFFRGFFLAFELTVFRKGRGLFFSTRAFFLGLGFANISMSLAFWTARFAASLHSRYHPLQNGFGAGHRLLQMRLEAS
jgi:hypothetical protein